MGALSGKTALVTGGSRGIGRSIVHRLASDGAKVLLSFSQNQAAADKVVAEVEEAGGRAFAVQANQGNLQDIERLFAAVDQHLGSLDIVVNNAAINPTSNIVDTTEANFDDAVAVNVKGPFFIIQHAATRLNDNGRIINLSTAGVAPGFSLYFATKSALEQITAVAAREFGGRGITANCVSPGATDTDMMRAAAGEYVEQAIAHVISQTALQRLGQPEDIANVVAFLAGPDSQWITGQTLRASGGLSF